VFGNVLVPTIFNIESLTRLPTGCAEQNMIAMVPTIAVLDYLISSNQQDDVTEKKLKAYLEAGYVNQLNFQRFDGSFSPFGESDASGSTWLTAFVAKGLLDAKKFIFTDDKVIEAAILWLIGKQTADGEFKEAGKSLHSAMQNPSTGGVALTAYVMMTLLAIPGGRDTFKDNLDTATDFINGKLESISDEYSLAIATYALQLKGDASSASYLKKLNARAIKKNSMMWWDHEHTTQPNHRTCSIDIENAAYGLLANMQAKENTNTFLIMNWLINEQNDKGGFRSTQDTVVAVQALAKLAARNENADTQMDVALDDGKIKQSLTIDDDNFLQTTNELSPTARNVKISASGKGFAIAQVSYKYNVKPSEPQPQFKLDLSLNPIPSARYLSVRVCANYIENDSSSASNMALMEVEFPSGYTFDQDSMERIVAVDVVKVMFFFKHLSILYLNYGVLFRKWN
jgi:CD109 antigen